MPTQPNSDPVRPQDYQPKKKKNKAKNKAEKLVKIAERADEATYNNGAWGQQASAVEFDIITPSGQRCRVKKMSVEALVFNGSIDDLDAISQLVQSKYIAPRKGAPELSKEDVAKKQARDGMKMLSDPNMKKAFAMVDKIVCEVVVAPDVKLRQEGVEAVPGQIYVDMIDIGDRFYIFSAVMSGMEEAATFRAEPSEAVADIQPL